MLSQIQKWISGAGTLLVTCLSIAILQSGSVMAAGDDDLFYVPPEVLPAGQPGDIIRARIAKAGPPRDRAIADAWQIMYLTTSAIGEMSAVTGTILVPKAGNKATMPIIGFAPGTQGPAFRCAPSRMINKGAFYEQSAVSDMLNQGYAVAMTDYEGYQPNPKTSYMVGPAMGPAVIDSVRAAMNFADAGLSSTAKIMFRGYSQGGAASLWAAQIQPTYAPELDLIGVVGGGVPAFLGLVALPLSGRPAFGVFFYTLASLENAYPALNINQFLSDAGNELVEEMNSSMCIVELVNELEGMAMPDFELPYPEGNTLNEPGRLTRIGESDLGKVTILAPVFQYHSIDDGFVGYGQASQLRQKYCSQGVDITWKEYDTQSETGIITHISGISAGNADVMQYMKDRFANKATSPNCDS